MKPIEIPQDFLNHPCRWVDKNYSCWVNMPDSKLPCVGYENCKVYEYDNGNYIKGRNDG